MINEYKFDKLIIGGSLESLLYSFINSEKILMLNPLYPFEMSKIDYCNSLRLVGYDNNRQIAKSELWDRLTFILSLTGLVVFPSIISNHRENDGEFIIITDNNKRINLSAEETVVFDTINSDKVFMYDWFNVRSGNNHDYEVLNDDGEFVSRVHFYRSKRIGRNKRMKDLVTESYVDRSKTQSPDYGEGIVRLKTLKMMKEAGIRGQSNGYSKLGKQQHYAIKIEHTHREIHNDYTPRMQIEELLKQEPERGEQWNLTKKLFRHKQITTLRGSFRLPVGL
jgi:hypothetical protein